MMTGLILAGGCSSRAKTNKLLLKVNNKPLILNTIASLSSLVDELVVVTGKFDKELRPYLSNCKVVYNKDYELGMFSSVKAGIKDIDSDLLILPGDISNVSSKTISAIIANKGLITIPTYKGKSGHPLFLNKEMVNKLKQEDINSNLRAFINSNIDFVNYVEVDDPFINFDVDTIEDYNRLVKQGKELTYES